MSDENGVRTSTRLGRKSQSNPKSPGVNQEKLCVTGATVCLSLSVIVLGISMPHLADGVSTITDCSWMTAMFMACVFDLSQIAAEFTNMVIPIVGLKNDRLKQACTFIMISCTLVSMTMNIRAFQANVETWFETIMAYVWGILLPILVLLLCYIASEFLMSSYGAGRKKR